MNTRKQSTVRLLLWIITDYFRFTSSTVKYYRHGLYHDLLPAFLLYSESTTIRNSMSEFDRLVVLWFTVCSSVPLRTPVGMLLRVLYVGNTTWYRGHIVITYSTALHDVILRLLPNCLPPVSTCLAQGDRLGQPILWYRQNACLQVLDFV